VNVQVEHLENHTVRLIVDVEPERMQKAMQSAAKRVGNKLNIPGFRRGKAPYNVIARYVGPAALIEEAIDDIGDSIYKQALEETKVEPYAMAQLEEVKTESGFQLVFSVPKQPEVDLGTYRDTIRLPFETSPVTEEAVDRFLRLSRDKQAEIEPAERAIQAGDQVKLHITGIVTLPHVHEHEHADEAEEAEHNHPAFEEEPVDEDIEVFVRSDEEDYLPGFATQLEGLSAGEEKTMLLVFSEDAVKGRKELIGGRAELTVKIGEVRNVTLPELDDAFAKKASNDKFETLADFRADSHKQLQETLDDEAKTLYAQASIEELVKGASFKFPEIAISETLDDMIAELKNTFNERGLALEDYLRIEKRTIESLRDDYRPAAIRRLRQALALGKLIEIEHMSVSSSEIDAKVDEMSQQFGEQAKVFKDMLNNPDSRNQIALDMLRDQAVARLTAIARGENPVLEAAPTVPANLGAVPVVVDGPTDAESEAPAATEPPAAETLA
jgi:trigger factor